MKRNRLENPGIITLAILSVASILAFSGVKCGDANDPNETPDDQLTFECEYDFVSGYDVFPISGGKHDYDYVVKAFNAGNTSFEPYIGSNAELADPADFTSNEEVYAFVKTNAECARDGSGNCIPFGSEISRLEHKSYLAGVGSWPTHTVLGKTLYSAMEGGALTMIFDDNIAGWYNSHSEIPGKRELVQQTVVHELGHLRANLPHVCNGFFVDNENHSISGSFICVMSGQAPREDECRDELPGSVFNFLGFCSICQNKLKQVTW